MTARYAAYVAPRPQDLWRFGSAIVGYDAERGEEVPPPAGVELPDDWTRLTAEPRRYGFHGTLKAPFALAPSGTERDLLDASAALAAGLGAVVVPRLSVEALGPFVALVPAAPQPGIEALASACVTQLEPFRAPLDEADRQRRLAAPLTDRQRRHLDLWGYPYVFADFRFHLTLTGPLPAGLVEPVRARLSEAYAGVSPGLVVDRLAIYRQEARDARFRVIARYLLQG